MTDRKRTSTNHRNEAELLEGCALASAMRVIGGRWKQMLLWYVHHGIARFSALRRTIPNITEKMLYQQLRELERDGLVLRVTSGRAVHYELTVLARGLVPILAELERWSTANDVRGRALASIGVTAKPKRDALRAS